MTVTNEKNSVILEKLEELLPKLVLECATKRIKSGQAFEFLKTVREAIDSVDPEQKVMLTPLQNELITKEVFKDTFTAIVEKDVVIKQMSALVDICLYLNAKTNFKDFQSVVVNNFGTNRGE